MTDLLIAFVIPVLVIVVAIVLQSLLKCPFKVAAIVFVLAIIAALIIDPTLINIILAWFYTLLAFITAIVIQRFFCGCNNDDDDDDSCGCNNTDLSNLINNGCNNCGCRNSGNNNGCGGNGCNTRCCRCRM